MIDLLTDFSNMNPFRIILCIDVKQLRSLYIYIYVFCVSVSLKKRIAHCKIGSITNINNLHKVGRFQEFLPETNPYKFSSNYFSLIIVTCFYCYIFSIV